MNILAWVLGGFCVLLICVVIVLYDALTISVAERERWYEPIKPVEFEILDGEVFDDER